MKPLFHYRDNRNAFTLIEVVVALVLLASLLVGMVTAYSAHHRQGILAMRRQQAIAAADQLLSQWFHGPNPQVPRDGQGILAAVDPSGTSMVWRTQTIHRNVIETLPVEVVRLQVFSSTALTRRHQATAPAPKPLAQVDVLLPDQIQ